MCKSFSQFAVLGAFALMICSLNACGGSSSEDEECLLGESMNECTENAGKCEAGNTYICERDQLSCLKWTLDSMNLLQCKNEEPACTAESTRCSDKTVQICKANASGMMEWVNGETCTTACSSGKCVDAVPYCYLENAVQCHDNTVQTCTKNSSGITVWMDGEVCSEKCQEGVCITARTCYQENAVQCSGKVVQKCTRNDAGRLEWTDTETCPLACSEGQCTSCATSCTPDEYKCAGKVLQKCVKSGECTAWETQKTCSAYCRAEYKTCTEDLPACKMKPGSQGTVLQWTDGDTLWVRAKTDGTCNDYEYDAESKQWKNIRFRIRVEGIDAPECSKKRNQYYYYVCTQDTSWTANNERMGYESWVAASEMLPYQYDVTFSCEKTQSDGSCDYDTTYDEDQEQEPRHVAYIGYAKNNASYDYSTEIARKGLAFANTESKFVKGTKKLPEICKAQQEAQKNKVGLWSLADTTAGVLKMMSKSKQNALYNLDTTCNNQIKNSK